VNSKFLIRKTFSFLSLIFLFPSCHVARYFWWNFADINDYKKFPYLEIHKGGQTYDFSKAQDNFEFFIPDKYNPDKKRIDFDSFLEKHKTVAFLIIRNDSIIYENYFAGYSDTSLLPCFSVAKAFVSALVGIAIDEGYIKSTEQSITDFIPELTDPDFQKITIVDLLNMRSGIKFNEGYISPFAEMAKYYYGKNLKKYITKLKIQEEPGLHYDYISVNTLLLSLALERATGMKTSEYLQNKIWQHAGMEHDASWNVDSKKHQTIKAFCCINARARDFARFGRLYLNKGKYRNKQIVPEKWVEISTSIINDSRDSQGYPYTYHWRVLENGDFFAKGILGQYIFVYPEKNLIFVRLGKKYAGIDWADLFLELSKQL